MSDRIKNLLYSRLVNKPTQQSTCIEEQRKAWQSGASKASKPESVPQFFQRLDKHA
ncbi:hypothetical protein BDW69DRAFT_173036 [Aspergillus filifer]